MDAWAECPPEDPSCLGLGNEIVEEYAYDHPGNVIAQTLQVSDNSITGSVGASLPTPTRGPRKQPCSVLSICNRRRKTQATCRNQQRHDRETLIGRLAFGLRARPLVKRLEPSAQLHHLTPQLGESSQVGQLL